MSSVLEALHDSLFNEYGSRTLGGLEADLGLYERLYRVAYGHAPDAALCDTLKAHLPSGELARVVEALTWYLPRDAATQAGLSDPIWSLEEIAKLAD